jgi:hypothetical protein
MHKSFNAKTDSVAAATIPILAGAAAPRRIAPGKGRGMIGKGIFSYSSAVHSAAFCRPAPLRDIPTRQISHALH